MKRRQYETPSQVLTTPNTQRDETFKALVKRAEEATKALRKEEPKKGRWEWCCGQRVWVDE